MGNDIITLVKETKTSNSLGDLVVTEEKRTVFAEVRSVSQSEFYQAAATGLKPEIKFVISDYLDYEDEKTLEYQALNDRAPRRFDIVRTFRDGNALEIVCQRGVDR